MMPKRKERIAFRIVTGTAPERDIVTSCAETEHKAINVVSSFSNKVNNIPIRNAKPLHVGSVHDDDFARAVNATQTVFVAVNRGVKLIVAADSNESENAVSAFRQIRIFGKAVRHNEISLAIFVLPNALSCGKRSVKSPGICDPRIEIFEDGGIGGADSVTDQRVVLGPRLPVDMTIGP